jgi:hypothetical protein
MNRDGSALVKVANDGNDRLQDWQPIPVGYARPKGATPLAASLVPAYNPCTAPNRTHGAPLAFGSCNPPSQASSNLTIGTPDANGKGANARASVLFGVAPGNPSTPADEAEVGIVVGITDIRNRSGLSDYTGQLQLVADLRITDRDNASGPGGVGSATVQDTPLSATISCAPTTSDTVGSDCNLSTTVDALFPGAVKEGRRAVWQLGQVRVNDGGPDGLASTASGNTLFLDQGVFIP